MTDETLPMYGDFALDAEARVLRGLLVPFGETSRQSASGHVATFAAGDITLPRDPAVVTLNREHDRHDPIGRATLLEKRPQGVYAEFTLADTDEADDWLSRQKGTLRKLSAEVRFAADRIRARLTGAALVTEGAFASAGLFALAEDGTPVEVTPSAVEGYSVAFIDPEGGVALVAPTLPPAIAVTTPEGESERYTPSDTPSEESREGEFAAMTSIVPDGVVTPEAPAAETRPDTSAGALFAALATASRTGNRSEVRRLSDAQGTDDSGLFAAYAPLADITATAAGGTFPPQFLGEIYRKDAFVQSVLPLFLHEDLKALQVNGWAWGTRPTVGAYAGDKAAIPSNTPTFLAINAVAERIAGGHDIDRALRDFGNEEFWASYFRIMVEEYKKLADTKVLAKISTAATVVAPTAVTGTQDPGTMALVDGALAVIANGYTPTFALVSREIFRSFLVTPKDKVLEYLSSAFAIDHSDGPGPSGGGGNLGGFRIIPNATLAAKRVIVGSKQAATVYELPGAAPVRVEGLDVAHAGIDPAVYGYVATLINDAGALASVTTL